MAPTDEDLSVLVLIGMRGCGKTANGVAAAKALGRAFIDLDDVFEEEVRSPPVNCGTAAATYLCPCCASPAIAPAGTR